MYLLLLLYRYMINRRGKFDNDDDNNDDDCPSIGQIGCDSCFLSQRSMLVFYIEENQQYSCRSWSHNVQLETIIIVGYHTCVVMADVLLSLLSCVCLVADLCGSTLLYVCLDVLVVVRLEAWLKLWHVCISLQHHHNLV